MYMPYQDIKTVSNKIITDFLFQKIIENQAYIF